MLGEAESRRHRPGEETAVKAPTLLSEFRGVRGGGTRVAVPPSKEKSVDVGPSVSPSFEKSTGVSPYIGRELVRGSESAGRLGIDE